VTRAMEKAAKSKGSKKKTVCLVAVTLLFAAFTIYNLLPKILPQRIESGPPVYFTNSKGFLFLLKLKHACIKNKNDLLNNISPPNLLINNKLPQPFYKHDHAAPEDTLGRSKVSQVS
jgi:hypothetical protein